MSDFLLLFPLDEDHSRLHHRTCSSSSSISHVHSRHVPPVSRPRVEVEVSSNRSVTSPGDADELTCEDAAVVSTSAFGGERYSGEDGRWELNA